jgi:RNA polymerase sigma-70 factor (ECF subfamily)
MPGEPEVRGLLALVLLHDARRPARVDPAGALVPLEEQDRSRWQQAAIVEGLDQLDAALAQRRRGPYQLQAAIAALHARASAGRGHRLEADRRAVRRTARRQPGAVVELNAAVALAMAEGPQHGLAWIDRLAQADELRDYHLLPACARGSAATARTPPTKRPAPMSPALELVRSPAERRYLERRLAECRA